MELTSKELGPVKENMIRILIYAVSVHQGGVEEYLLNLYRMLDRSCIQFDFIVVGEGKFYAHDEVRRLGGELYYLSEDKLFNIMKREKPRHQILYFNICAWYRPQPLMFARMLRYEHVVSHAHNTRDTSRSPLLSLLHYVNRIAARAISERCFACSELAGYWIYGKKYFKSSQKCKVIPNAIELERFRYKKEDRIRIREECGIPRQAFVAVQVGRMTYQKNQAFTIKVFAHLCELIRDKDLRLLMVGEGEDRLELERICESEGIGNKVSFLGRRKDISALFSASDALILPSRYEGLVVVGVESQASGLPIVASNKVTEELDMSGLVEYLPIDSGCTLWAERIKLLVSEVSEDQRAEDSDKAIASLMERGYGSRELAMKMSELFNGLVNPKDGIR